MSHAAPLKDVADLVTLPRRPPSRGYRVGGQGSSKLTLLAYDVLYDAGRPLTLDEVIDAMVPQISEIMEGYLLAWFYRQRENQHRRDAQRYKRDSTFLSGNRNVEPSPDNGTEPPSEIQVPRVPRRRLVQAWLKANFVHRAYIGTTLRKVEAGFEAGPKPPRILTVDGELLDYTAEERRRQAHLQQAGGETQAILMELTRVLAELEARGLSPDDRLIPISWLAQRFADQATATDGKRRFSGTQCRGLFHHVVKYARFPETKQAVLQRLLEWAFKATPKPIDSATVAESIPQPNTVTSEVPKVDL